MSSEKLIIDESFQSMQVPNSTPTLAMKKRDFYVSIRRRLDFSILETKLARLDKEVDRIRRKKILFKSPLSKLTKTTCTDCENEVCQCIPSAQDSMTAQCGSPRCLCCSYLYACECDEVVSKRAKTIASDYQDDLVYSSASGLNSTHYTLSSSYISCDESDISFGCYQCNRNICVCEKVETVKVAECNVTKRKRKHNELEETDEYLLMNIFFEDTTPFGFLRDIKKLKLSVADAVILNMFASKYILLSFEDFINFITHNFNEFATQCLYSKDSLSETLALFKRIVTHVYSGSSL